MKIKKQNIILLDLFSGIGGFALGIQQAGFTITKHYYSEINPYSIANYKYNFKNAIYTGSVQTINRKTVSRPNIITFGSPCQNFSNAGKRTGLAGSQSSLINEAIRIIGELRPSVFIWENVKGTFSSNNGKDFWKIIKAFTNIGGYRLEWQLLNTKWFLPQNRERIYLVGHLAGESEPRVFPIGATNDWANEMAAKTQHNGTILASEQKGINRRSTLINQINPTKDFGNTSKQQNRVYLPTGIMCALSSSRLEDKSKIALNSVTYDNSISRTIRSSGHQTPTAKHNFDTIITKGNIRRLTEIECERLQGFPDDFTKWGVFKNDCIKPIAKTQRYKMIGNAVTVNVVQAIATKLLNP